MIVNSVYLGDRQYNLSPETCDDDNVFSIIIGKNGSGKSRLLSKIANDLITINSYNQNHSILKREKKRELKISSKDKSITVISGKGRRNRLIQNNKANKKILCDSLIATSISPFDKFPIENSIDDVIYNNVFSRHKKNKFYSYIGFRTGKASLSDNALISNFTISVINKRNNCAISRVLKILGYKDEIRIHLKHVSRTTTSKYFRSDFIDDSSTIVNHDIPSGLIRHALDTNNIAIQRALLSDQIFKSSNNIRKFKGRSMDLSDVEFNEQLPKEITLSSSFSEIMKNSLIRRLELDLTTVKDISLMKVDSKEIITLTDSSSGERALLLLVCSIANKIRDNTVILIDEPEISLHPEWQEGFISLIQNAFSHYKGCHFIIATHSPLIISRSPENNCYILNLDKNKLVNSSEYHERSADYQLATLFSTPGYKNEYLNRICVSVLSHITKNGNIDSIVKADIDFLLSVKDRLEDGDTVKSLINIIEKTMGFIK
ncbi:hypothetical protein BCT30_18065 [Enterovibrio norvegicus]|uniref:AAA family ATPase n=1 Tax=Enterovibrio norvegicus TaxID=188144 RepID=UPI000C82BA59|nr:AAA family ATPase [Enterovibrio norvegicus]MCC4798663.1 ATP-binding protein [Enterovibrio norvegicus]PMI36908.1 hypothetical protein BCU46_01650 [Enterovibrio norvegicus]PMN49418.1 hypothetical protein BCT30_18065 [Enterovibrio norvegicus]